MKKLRKLKLSTIIAAGGTCGQVKLFRKMFGEFVIVTEKLVASVSDKFNLPWAARYLLSMPARKQFDADTSMAREQFYADITAAWEQYFTDTEVARKRYNADISTAWKRYCVAIAPIWARTYINDGGKK